VVDKNTGDAIRITDLRQLDAFDSKTHDFAYITESVNEALPKFKTPYEAYSWIMNKRGEAMDIETEMLNISGEIHDKYKDMEQEAEAGGGPIADRYGKEIEALENKHKELRAQFAAIMAEIDEYDQNY
jgi:chromosome segregation ATPase